MWPSARRLGGAKDEKKETPGSEHWNRNVTEQENKTEPAKRRTEEWGIMANSTERKSVRSTALVSHIKRRRSPSVPSFATARAMDLEREGGRGWGIFTYLGTKNQESAKEERSRSEELLKGGLVASDASVGSPPNNRYRLSLVFGLLKDNSKRYGPAL